MKVPVSWLKEYVKFDADIDELVHKLTFSGLEIEGIDTIDSEDVLDIEVTPNRPDCLSIIGVARELAALFGSELKLPSVKLKETNESVEDCASVSIEDTEGCPRYTARVLKGVKIGESPDFIKKRLLQCGIKSINNIVDITNYVLMECGQPLHAFDKDLVSEGGIIVRRATAGEKMATLDDVERELDSEMLVIADKKQAVALAGVMGGATSEISESTEDVLLESAYFKPVDIRKTSKKLGLMTEASYRFERGVDVLTVEWASKRAAALMAEHAGAEVLKGVIDEFPEKLEETQITCRFGRVSSLLGIDISNERIVEIFNLLELSVVEQDGEVCTVKIPSFRVDLVDEIDLIEEIARINGLDEIPDDKPRAEIVPTADDSELRKVLACRSNLVGLGLSEIMNYSLVSPELLDVFDKNNAGSRIPLSNPNSNMSILRPSLIPQMMESLGRNLSYQTATAKFFEIGRVFFKDAAGSKIEEERLCVGLMGKVGRWDLEMTRPVKPDEAFLRLKGLVVELLSAQQIDKVEMEPLSDSYFENGYSVSLKLDGQLCGIMGLVKKSICDKWRMVDPVGCVEIKLLSVLSRIFDIPSAVSLPVYPSVDRDAAVIIDQNVSHEDIVKTVWESAPVELTDVELFDIYKGKGIESGKKSHAYSFVYRSCEKTLTDEEVNEYHEKIKSVLKNKLNAEIREN